MIPLRGGGGVRELGTPRLRLRRVAPEADAAFLLRLLNEESFLRFIGDRGVRSLEDAARYARRGPLESYARHGFGLLLVERRPGRTPIGICGLLQRESLDAPDLGFAFVPEAWGQGLAREAAAAVLADARWYRGPGRIVAITQPGNAASIRLLTRLGFHLERRVCLAPGGPELELHASDRASRAASADCMGAAPPDGSHPGAFHP